MDEITDNIKQITNPQQAVEQYLGEQFIEWLLDYVLDQMKDWPIMDNLKTSQPKPEKIKKFMLQRFLAAEAFLGSREGDPGFLRFAIANLSESDDPTAESALEVLEKRRQQELAGHRVEHGIIKTPARDLWVRLLRALGAGTEEIEKIEPKETTRNYIADLSDLFSNSDWQTAVGAYAAYEQAVAYEYQQIAQMLRRSINSNDQDLEALTRHEAQEAKFSLDTGHILDKIVFDAEAKQQVFDGAQRQLAIRQDFLNSLAKYLK